MFRTSILSAAVVAASLPALSLAQNTDETAVDSPLETLVVIASRRETPLRQLGTSVSVLDEEALKTLGTPALADALRSLPSVSVANSGGMGKASSLRIRGEAGYRTLVRVDGVDISDPTGTQVTPQVHHLLNANVGRVEVLRGPQGMMYGADAGGVVNISTDHVDDGLESGVRAEAGRYNSRQYSGYVGGGNEQGDFYLSAAQSDTDGFNARQDDPSADEDGYDNTTVHARGGWNFDPDLRVQLVVRDTDASSEYDRCGFPEVVDDCVEDFEQRNLRGSVTHGNEHGENTLAYSKTDVSRINYTGGELAYGYEGEIAKWELNGQLALDEAHSLVYGAEQRRDQLSERERDQRGAYLEYQGEYAERFYLTAGVRQDDNDDFGGHTSYRVSGAWLWSRSSAGEWKLKSSLGTGFRAPSLYEIDYNESLGIDGLPELDPEESRGLDAGIEYLGRDGTYLELVLFDQTIDDEIYFDMVETSAYLQGGQSSESRGVELVAQKPLNAQLQLTGNYTYVDAEADDGSPRSRQPEHMANIGVRYTPARAWTLALDWRTARDRHDNGIRLDDYQVLNAHVRYEGIEGVTLFVRGDNVLDEDYVEVSPFNTSGAAAYAGVELSF